MRRRTAAAIAAVSTFAVSGLAHGTKPALKPEQASQRLFAAWQAHDRKAARAIATKEAVDKLFSVRRQSMRFDGCHVKDEGGFQCVFVARKLDLRMAMEVDGGASLGGYNVTSVSFSSEE